MNVLYDIGSVGSSPLGLVIPPFFLGRFIRVQNLTISVSVVVFEPANVLVAVAPDVAAEAFSFEGAVHEAFVDLAINAQGSYEAIGLIVDDLTSDHGVLSPEFARNPLCLVWNIDIQLNSPFLQQLIEVKESKSCIGIQHSF